MQRFNVREPYFSFIRNGLKTKEGRGGKSRLVLDTEIGEIVQFFDGEKAFEAAIVDKKSYSTIEEMLRKEGFKDMIPDAESFEAAVAVYKGFNWNESDGFCAVHLQVLSDE